MKKLVLCLVIAFLGITGYSQNVLFNNGIAAGGSGVGGFVTPGSGAGGAPISQVVAPMTTLGAGAQALNRNRVADDFTVPASTTWVIDSVLFYCYQTGSSTTSTITEVRLRLWDNIPGQVGSNVLFGDTTTNRMGATRWSGVYRVGATVTDATRPIMVVRANLPAGGIVLNSGTYWMDWSYRGTLASGPWANPITIQGQQTTGDARQSLADGPFNPLLDGGSSTALGLPFVLYGAPMYQVAFSAGANGSVAATVDGSAITSGANVRAGKNVVFTATPNTGFRVAQWSVNSTPVAGNTSNNFTLTNLQANSTVEVTFEPIPTYIVTFSAGANGSVSATVDGSAITSGASVLAGKDIVFTATPNTGFRVAQWSVNSTPVAGNTSNNFTLTNLQANSTVEVTFEPIPTYIVTFSAGANGSVSATVDGSAITSGASVLAGKDVVFTATPNTGFRVAQWSVNSTPVSGNTSNNYTLTNLQANSTVAVTFEAIPTFVVTFSAGANGSVAATVDGSPITSGASVQQGKNVVFTATPNTDFRVAEWRLNGNVVANNTSNNYTFENIQAATNVTVSFVTTITALSTLKQKYDINCYPNPFGNNIYVENNRQQLNTIVLQNSLGKTIQKMNADNEINININTQNLASGVYLISFYTKDGQVFTQKLVKQ